MGVLHSGEALRCLRAPPDPNPEPYGFSSLATPTFRDGLAIVYLDVSMMSISFIIDSFIVI